MSRPEECERLILDALGKLEHLDVLVNNVGPFLERSLGETTARLVGYTGRIEWDATRPDGMPRKCLDVSKLHALGWTPAVSLEAGIAQLVREYEGIRAA